MCEYCKFDYLLGKQIGKPFPDGFGITAAIKQDRYFYLIVDASNGDDGIIYGIEYCPKCGRKLAPSKLKVFFYKLLGRLN